MTEQTHPDTLEDRFTQPPGWRWHYIKVGERKMRFGTASPQDSVPDAVIVCLPGLSEFCEKYFETARDMLNKNYAFWVIDWMGQGLSDRYLPNPHKRHSNGFEQDVSDLHAFIVDYIKHSSVHPDRGRIPMVMLAHSMGANIGMHYLKQYPDTFECAALSAPMLGVKKLAPFPKPLRRTITTFMSLIAGDKYVSGGGDWKESSREDLENNVFSSDLARSAISNAWFNHNPSLQVGNVTYGWVHSAVESCLKLQKPEALKAIQTHCLLTSSEHETLVNNHAIIRAAQAMPNAQHIELKGAKHEILMETDEIRDTFLEAFDKLIQERIIDRPETLKPF